MGLTVHYARGAFSAAASAQQVEVGAVVPPVAPSTRQRAYLLATAYDFGLAKLFATYDATSSNVTGLRTRTGHIGTSVPVGPGAVLMSWARTRSLATRVNSTRDTAALGYDYKLSKRTDLYTTYLFDRLHGHGAGNSFLVGMQQKF